uniref:Uncharacterized protein LOC111104408 n=1 Tax=Crassostrea virginica TaxID=6565 RepID=A0A8B8AS80_CRAVI|nr:uncharacterized protein LOC111104408 [Crassostrea virginica]
MDFERMNVLRLFIVLLMLTGTKGAINITFGYSECKGDPVNETDRGIRYDYINTTCDCTITSKWNGTLYMKSHQCKTDTRINIINSNGTLIKTLCRSEAPSPKVYQDSVLFLNVEKNRRDANNVQSRNYNEQTVKVTIYTDKNTTGLFSVTCGPGFGSTTKSNTRPTSTTASIITSERKYNSSPKSVSQRTSLKAFASDNFVGLPSTPAIKDASVVIDTSTFGNNFSSSKPKIPYIYVAAAGSVAVVAITIFMIICIRKINSARSTSKVDTNEDGTNNDATNGSKRPENIDGSKQQHLLDNPLFHSHLAIVDCEYSTYGSENQGSTEQLPDNPLYHSYYENGDTADSKNAKEETGFAASQENNVLYQDDLNENQNENVYAQVKKLTGT